MGRLSVLAAIVLMFSAISLVTARYQARQLYTQLDKYTTQAEDLEIDWRKLQLDRAQASRNAHVDKVAREELRMNVIAPDRTIYVSQPLANQSPASQSAPESGSRR
jgi:cell division protein FtsL